MPLDSFGFLGILRRQELCSHFNEIFFLGTPRQHGYLATFDLFPFWGTPRRQELCCDLIYSLLWEGML